MAVLEFTDEQVNALAVQSRTSTPPKDLEFTDEDVARLSAPPPQATSRPAELPPPASQPAMPANGAGPLSIPRGRIQIDALPYEDTQAIGQYMSQQERGLDYADKLRRDPMAAPRRELQIRQSPEAAEARAVERQWSEHRALADNPSVGQTGLDRATFKLWNSLVEGGQTIEFLGALAEDKGLNRTGSPLADALQGLYAGLKDVPGELWNMPQRTKTKGKMLSDLVGGIKRPDEAIASILEPVMRSFRLSGTAAKSMEKRQQADVDRGSWNRPIEMGPAMNAGQAVGDVTGGLADFMVKYYAAGALFEAGVTAKVVPEAVSSSHALSTAAKFEIVNQMNGGRPGEGAVDGLVFGALGTIPGKALKAEAAKVAAGGGYSAERAAMKAGLAATGAVGAESAYLAGSTAARGGSTEDAVIQALVPLAMRLPAFSGKVTGTSPTRGDLMRATEQLMKQYRPEEIQRVIDETIAKEQGSAEKDTSGPPVPTDVPPPETTPKQETPTVWDRKALIDTEGGVDAFMADPARAEAVRTMLDFMASEGRTTATNADLEGIGVKTGKGSGWRPEQRKRLLAELESSLAARENVGEKPPDTQERPAVSPDDQSSDRPRLRLVGSESSAIPRNTDLTKAQILDGLETLSREEAIELLKAIDRDGIWTDRDAESEGMEPLTLEGAREALKDLVTRRGDSSGQESDWHEPMRFVRLVDAPAKKGQKPPKEANVEPPASPRGETPPTETRQEPDKAETSSPEQRVAQAAQALQQFEDANKMRWMPHEERAKNPEWVQLREEADKAVAAAETAGVSAGPRDRSTITTGSGPELDVVPSVASIRAQIENDFGVPMREGRISARTPDGQKAGAQYDSRQQVIRESKQLGGDLGVIAHEFGHHVETRKGIVGSAPQTVRVELAGLDYVKGRNDMHEGFSEFMREYLVGDSAANAPQTHDWFTQKFLTARHNAEFARRIGELKANFDAWRSPTSHIPRVLSRMSFTGKPERPENQSWIAYTRDRIDYALNRVYEAIKASDRPFAIADKWLKSEGKSTPGEMTLAESYLHWRRSGFANGLDAIRDGVFNLSDPYTRTSRGLGEILRMAGGDDKYKLFSAFLAARGAREAWASNDAKKADYIRKGGDPAKWNEDYNPGMSREEAIGAYDELLAKHPEFKAAADEYTRLGNAALDMLVDVGAISADSAAAMMKAWPEHVILERVVDPLVGKLGSGRGMVAGKAVYARTGSGAPIIDPIQRMAARIARLYQIAAKQSFTNYVIDTALRVGQVSEFGKGSGAWIERVAPGTKMTRFSVEEVVTELKKAGLSKPEIDAIKDMAERLPDGLDTALSIFRPDYVANASKGEVRFMRNGQPEIYVLNKDLYRAFTHMTPDELPFTMDILFGTMTRFQKLGLTGLNTFFAVQNPLRDVQSFLANTTAKNPEIAAADIPVMIGKYIWSAARHLEGKAGDPIVDMYLRFGGKGAMALGNSPKEIMRAVKLAAANSKTQLAYKIASNPILALREVIGISEIGPRLEEFKITLAKYGYTADAIRNGAKPNMDIIGKALQAAADVTVDFSRTGVVGDWLNRYGLLGPFFNAGIEGTDKFLRTVRDYPQRQLWRAAKLASATAAYWLMKKDEDWYKEAEPWLKYGYFTYTDSDGNPVVRLRRSQDFGLLVSAGTEALLNAMNEKNPEAIKQWAGQVLQSTNPISGPAGFKAILEAGINYDFFRQRKIVSDSLERRPPAEQYAPQTTLLMRKVGEYLNMSPAKLEHLAEGLTAGLYGGVERKIERVVKGQGETKRVLPFVGGLLINSESSIKTRQFYENALKAEQQWNSARDKGDLDRDTLGKHRLYSTIGDVMADLRRPIRGESDRFKRLETERYIIGLARWVDGQEELDRYPNPLRVPVSHLPEEVGRTIRDLRSRMNDRLDDRSKPPQTRTPKDLVEGKTLSEKLVEWQASRDVARKILDASK